MGWTKKDRVMAVLSGEIPDRVPIFECLIHDGILEHFGGKPIHPGDSEGVISASAGCLDICHPALVPQEPGEEILENGSRKINERWSSWEVPFPGRNLEVMAGEIKDEIDRLESYKVDCDEIRLLKKKFKINAGKTNCLAGEMVYIHIGTGVRILPGTIEEGIYLYADYQALMERWNIAVNNAELRRIEIIADSEDSPVMINWTDIAFKNKLIYPPYMLEKLFYPHLEKCCHIAHSKGMKVIYHSDGYMNEAMQSIVNCGIDGFNPLEISAGMEYADFKGKYGNKVAIVGGLDAVDILAYGSVDKVIEETRRLLSIAGKDGGLIAASASGEIDNSMPMENVLAYFDTIWKYGIYT